MESVVILHLGQGMWKAIQEPASLHTVLLLQPLTDSFQVCAVRDQAISLEDFLQEGIPSCCPGL